MHVQNQAYVSKSRPGFPIVGGYGGIEMWFSDAFREYKNGTLYETG